MSAQPADPATARKARGALEALHVTGYFADEPRLAYKAVGLRASHAYFAARSAPMGAVPPEVCEATFYVFAPALVRAALPAAWSVATPEQVTGARLQGVDAALRRILGEAAQSPEVDEAAALARQACDALTAPGRALYAGHASLPWPASSLLQLWHAASLLREHRGDGHVAALLGAGLNPLDAIITGGAAAGTTAFMRRSRGWTDSEWQAAQRGLHERELLDDDGALTPAGTALRAEVEARTNAAATAGWDHLGPDRTARLAELVRPLQKTILSSGVLPADILPRR